MSNKSEANILADAFESVRTLTKWYISKMKEVDMYKEFEVEGKKLNSAYWLVAHLIWAENFLLLECLGSNGADIPWLGQFSIKSKMPESRAGLPEIKEMLDAWKTVHAKAMEHVRSLPDELLDTENPLGIGFGDDKTHRMMIQHAIRHEALHTGHLSWICKLYGIKTV